jgi:two-component system chemotaxis response regulator CheY
MEGFGECETVECGLDAIAAFGKAWEIGIPFDMISLDILMPDMSGIEVLKKIRSMEKGKEVPKSKQVKIMMVTSLSDKDNVATSMISGCNSYIVKPFDRERILHKLEDLGFEFN